MKSATFMSFLTLSAGYVFQPENETDFRNPNIPGLFNYTESQFDISTGSSYWISSYITGNDGRQYMALSHLLTTHSPSPVCRSSIIDLELKEYWVDLTYCTSTNGSGFDNGKPLNADYGTYAFGSTSDDSVSSMYAYAHTDKGFSIDLEWNLTSRVMLNGGTGIIPFGNVPVNATEWGVPAGRTTGTITVNNKTIAVNPCSSFTWYDRQLSHGAPKNWTWFEINFPGSDVKASVWAYDLIGDESTRFATVRSGNSYHVVAYDLEPDYTKTWTSPKSNITYPLSWNLNFENGDHLLIESIRPDQEMYGDKALVDSAYEGFVKVRGSFYGQEEGFGVAELVSVY
ncbi:secreted hydrolase-like protein [Colletotrichum karsti]|uniref:Secreted hydrolase-like protein n=1 Tax=Colletotrichum karsti TaxID=1095194 RepID=A0A9P6I358_9PEZI|nr:secreted hydrolase-like protein [Colletotrichum karsti]KAF9871090.1 secreted hydrolase-like protein [Colletotrichum karsti]